MELARSTPQAVRDTESESQLAADAAAAVAVVAAPSKDGKAGGGPLPVELGDGPASWSCSTGARTSSYSGGIGAGAADRAANHTVVPCGGGGRINSLVAAAAAAIISNWKALWKQ